jgi:hypothetical protein
MLFIDIVIMFFMLMILFKLCSWSYFVGKVIIFLRKNKFIPIPKGCVHISFHYNGINIWKNIIINNDSFFNVWKYVRDNHFAILWFRSGKYTHAYVYILLLNQNMKFWL